MKLLREAVLLSAVLAAAGCDYHNDKVSGDLTALNRPVGYTEVRDKVFAPSCIDCHRTQNPQLDTYAAAAKALSDIRETVFDKQTMPKRGSLTADQKAVLLAWLNQGAPEGEPAPPLPSPSPRPPGEGPPKTNWTIVKTKVLDVACNSCHFAGNTAGLSDLTNLDFTRAQIGSVVGLSLSNMMPPPENSQPLADEQKRLLTEWWIAGLPEN